MENKEKDVVEVTEQILAELAEKESCSCGESEYKPICPPYELSEKEMSKFVASEGFKKGLADSAYAVGMFAGLVNGGIDVMLAHEIVAGMLSKEAQIQLQTMAIEMAKIKSVQAEKCEL